MSCPDIFTCDYNCLRRGVCDHEVNHSLTKAKEEMNKEAGTDWKAGFVGGYAAGTRDALRLRPPTEARGEPVAYIARSTLLGLTTGGLQRGDVYHCARGEMNIALYSHPPAREAVDDAMVKQLKAMVSAWEALPEGFYTVDTMQKWIVDDLKPQIDAIRTLLAALQVKP